MDFKGKKCGLGRKGSYDSALQVRPEEEGEGEPLSNKAAEEIWQSSTQEGIRRQ